MITRYQTLLSEINLFTNQSGLSYNQLIQFVGLKTAQLMGVDRVSFWDYYSFDDKEDEIHSIILIQNQKPLPLNNSIILSQRDFPKYFNAITNQRQIVASQARIHPDTAEFNMTYFKPLEIHSMLDVPIKYKDKTLGLICFEVQRTVKEWTPEEVNFCSSLGDILSKFLISQVLGNLIEQVQELKDLNQAGSPSTDLQKSIQQINIDHLFHKSSSNA